MRNIILPNPPVMRAWDLPREASFRTFHYEENLFFSTYADANGWKKARERYFKTTTT